MSNKKKFSQFQLPTTVDDLWLVGYQSLTGENTNVKIKAHDLAFNTSGAAGVGSINGLTNSVTIQGSNGITVDTTTDNTITIIGTKPLTVEHTFNPETKNPLSGIAINTALTQFANKNNTNIFTGSQFFTDITTNSFTANSTFRCNGNAIFNGNLTIQGNNLNAFISNTRIHNNNSSLHLTQDDRNNITNLLGHANNTNIHLTLEEKNNLATKEDLALKADLTRVETTETVTDWDNKSEWGLDKANIKNYTLSANHAQWGTISSIGIGTPAAGGNETITTAETAHYLIVEVLNSSGEVVETFISTNKKKMLYSKVNYWDFEPFTLRLEEDDKIRISFSTDGITPSQDAVCRAEVVKENGSTNNTNGSFATNSNGGISNWLIRTVFKCAIKTTIQQKLNDHTNNTDLHLTLEEKQLLLSLLEHKEALLALLSAH